MTSRSPKGFTLLELLIVIAIIGILSAVVLASLGQARARGADAAIKSALVQARTQAELYVDANGKKYTNVCDAADANGTKSMYSILSDLAQKQGYTYYHNDENFGGSGNIVICNDDSVTPSLTDSGWAIQARLKSSSASYLCIDSTGRIVTLTSSRVYQGEFDCL